MKNKSSIVVTMVLVFMCGWARADWVTLNIFVDGVVIGEVPVDLREQQPVSLNGAVLLKLIEPYMAFEKVQRLNRQFTDDNSLSIEDLSRVGIGSEYSEKELALVLTIPLSMRVVKDFPLAMKRGRTGKSLYDKNFSGFFNYSLLGSYTVQSKPGITTRGEDPKEGAFAALTSPDTFWYSREYLVERIQP